MVAAARLDRIRDWLSEPKHASRLWLGKPCVIVAWLGLFLAVVTPPHGSGLSVCWFESATGLPCPGCGLTRSLSCGLRGMFPESWHYHPMGLFILALFIFTAAQSLLPQPFRAGLARKVQARAKTVNLFYLVFVTVFVSFGAVRALHHYGSVLKHLGMMGNF
jgi:hypothetical protein